MMRRFCHIRNARPPRRSEGIRMSAQRAGVCPPVVCARGPAGRAGRRRQNACSHVTCRLRVRCTAARDARATAGTCRAPPPAADGSIAPGSRGERRLSSRRRHRSADPAATEPVCVSRLSPPAAGPAATVQRTLLRPEPVCVSRLSPPRAARRHRPAGRADRDISKSRASGQTPYGVSDSHGLSAKQKCRR